MGLGNDTVLCAIGRFYTDLNICCQKFRSEMKNFKFQDNRRVKQFYNCLLALNSATEGIAELHSHLTGILGN